MVKQQAQKSHAQKPQAREPILQKVEDKADEGMRKAQLSEADMNAIVARMQAAAAAGLHRKEDRADEGMGVEVMARRQLLAQLAGNIAAGIFASPNEPPSTAAGVAEIAVDVAEAILQKVDL